MLRVKLFCVFLSLVSFSSFAEENEKISVISRSVGCGGLVEMSDGTYLPEEYAKLVENENPRVRHYNDDFSYDEDDTDYSEEFADMTEDMDDLQKMLFSELSKGNISHEEVEEVENSKNR